MMWSDTAHYWYVEILWRKKCFHESRNDYLVLFPRVNTIRTMSNKIIIKTPEQIAWIRRASRLTHDVLDMIGQYVRVGVSTLELDTIMNEFTIRGGGTSACIHYLWANRWGKWGYPRFTCISLNDVICHGIPREDEILTEWDILNIDVTSIVDGFFWDASRMFTIGTVSPKARKVIDVAKKSLEIGIEQVRPWAHFWDIGFAINAYVTKEGCSVVRDYTWHWVGVRFHEDPHVFHRAEKGSWPVIRPWMIFTIEPMVNIGKYQTKLDADNWTVRTKDWSLSAQWEHTILVTEEWKEILT